MSKKLAYSAVRRKKVYLKCTNCTDLIISLHVHDWRACSCYRNEPENKGCFIDGGDYYTRVGFNADHKPTSGKGLFEIDYNKQTFKLIEVIDEKPNTVPNITDTTFA